jgi:cell division protein FtsW (lipid II flippase)
MDPSIGGRSARPRLIQSLGIFRRTLLFLLPALTLVLGIGLAELAAGQERALRPNEAGALAVAVVGPLIAMLVLLAVNRSFDWMLVATAGMLTAIGTATLFSLSLTQGTDGGFYSTIVIRHALFVGAGFVALTLGVVLARHLDRIRRIPFTLLVIALVLIVVTIAFGETVNGARLWLQIGAIQFQPSELARLLLAGFVAIYLYDRRYLVITPWRVGSIDLPPAPYLLPLVGAVLAAVAVLVFQNDLGMAALVVLGAYASVASVLSSKWSLGSAGAILIVGAIASFAASPRVRERVAAWLEPWYDPAGRGFQFVQAEFVLAAGGIFGEGATAPAARVPEVHTDFILVALAAQWGWLGAVAVLALAGIVVCRCVAAALRAGDGFRSLLALGIAALVGIQVLLICGGTLRILPLTGLTFPLVSSGGTSMIATLFALGIVAGIGAPRVGRVANASGAVSGRRASPIPPISVGHSELLRPISDNTYTS